MRSGKLLQLQLLQVPQVILAPGAKSVEIYSVLDTCVYLAVLNLCVCAFARMHVSLADLLDAIRRLLYHLSVV